MRGNGTIYKRCGCRDPRTGRQRGTSCPHLKRRGHGSWYLALPAPATLADHRERLRRGGYRTRTDTTHAGRRAGRGRGPARFLTACHVHLQPTRAPPPTHHRQRKGRLPARGKRPGQAYLDLVGRQGLDP
ncbi:hypothetical protein P3T39_007471 [Kitasatospora sp. GP82]|nr:hypothetical protein [Kitasatospora sp. GP82]